jgi:hypothetical protein
MIPINLVLFPLMSESLIIKVKETSLPDIRLKILTEKSIRLDETIRWSTDPDPCFDPVDDDDEDPVLRLLISNDWQCVI